MPYEENKSIKMNESFVFMYLLQNSDEKLKIQLMNLVKNMMPLPIYINQIDHILDMKENYVLNNELIWILKEGITVASIGLHSKDNLKNEKQTGKSSFLNHIFYTNFPESDIKHKIIQKIPFVSIRVYDDLFPLNIIDIPKKCSKEIRDNIIKSCNILFVHSWRDEEESLKLKK